MEMINGPLTNWIKKLSNPISKAKIFAHIIPLALLLIPFIPFPPILADK
jgi:hypothetical protein